MVRFLLLLVLLAVPRCEMGEDYAPQKCHTTREWQMEPVGSCWVGVV